VAGLEARALLTAVEARESLPEMELNVKDMREEGAEPLSDTMDMPARVKLVLGKEY
jgi:hypothetical protein